MTSATVSTQASRQAGQISIHFGESFRADETTPLHASRTGSVKSDTAGLVSPGVAASFAREVTEPLAARLVAAGDVVRQRYVLEHVIGSGGDSTVFRARDLHRALTEETAEGVIALKVLRPERRFDPLALRRLKRSFIQMQCLTNPRIARVFDLDSDDDVWFMSMELIAGRDMKAWAREDMSLGQRLKVLAACCEALAYAHSMGIVHGDLKPSNVLVTGDDEVKMIDFGSARTPEVDVDSGLDLSAAATVAYASPQILAGSRVETRDDIFSLACLSYEVLSKGLHPFDGQSPLEAWRTRMCPVPIPDIPAPLFEVLARGLSLEREQRPRSAQEFLNELVEADSSRCVISGDGASRPVTESSKDIDSNLQVPSSVEPLSADNPPQELPRTRRLFSPFGKEAWARISLPALPTRLFGYWHAAFPSLQMTLVMVIAGLAVFSVSGRIVHQNTPPLVKLVPSTKSPTPYQPPSPVEILDSAPVQPKPTVVAEPKPVFHAPGAVEFESATITAGAEQSLIAIPVRRLRSTQGRASVAWAIEGGTAQPGVDFKAMDPKVIRFFEGQKVRVLFIQLLKSETTAAARGPRTFTVGLRKVATGPALGPLSRVTVTIAPVPVLSGSGPDGHYR